MTQIILSTKLSYKIGISRSSSPARESVMNGQKVRIPYYPVSIISKYRCIEHAKPDLNDILALSASCSKPNGVMKGDLEFSAAAIVRAGSRHRNRAAIRRNLPRCTSVGSLLSSRPIGVISSVVDRALTSISEETARWMLTEDGGSKHLERTSEIELPKFTFRIFILSARSDKLQRNQLALIVRVVTNFLP